MSQIHSDELNFIISYGRFFYKQVVSQLPEEQKENFWDIFFYDANFKSSLNLNLNYKIWEKDLMMSFPDIDLRRLVEIALFLDNSELLRVSAMMVANAIKNTTNSKKDIKILFDNPIYPETALDR